MLAKKRALESGIDGVPTVDRCTGCAVANTNKQEITGIVCHLNGRLKEAFDKVLERMSDLEERLQILETAAVRKQPNISFMYSGDEDSDSD